MVIADPPNPRDSGNSFVKSLVDAATIASRDDGPE
jgi:hypothetical protein